MAQEQSSARPLTVGNADDGIRAMEDSTRSTSNSASIGRTILLDNHPPVVSQPIFSSRASVGERSASMDKIMSDGKNGQKSAPLFIQREVSGKMGKSTATVRKRSRIGGFFDTEALKVCEGGGQGKKFDELLVQLQTTVENMIKKGEKGKNINDKLQLNEIMSEISMEVISCLSFSNSLVTRMIELQEEKIMQEQKLQKATEESNQLRQQIIELQVQATGATSQQHAGSSSPYLHAVMRKTAMNIKEGTSMPLPSIPDIVKHSPAERILIFQAKTKGETSTKKEQETFRADIREAIGEELTK